MKQFGLCCTYNDLQRLEYSGISKTEITDFGFLSDLPCLSEVVVSSQISDEMILELQNKGINVSIDD